MKCRHCHAKLKKVFLDLGKAPPSNSYLSRSDLRRPETFFPLRLLVCSVCNLVQTEDHASADTFFSSDYAYYSSTSKSWLAHTKSYCETVTQRFALNDQSFVVEVASNDGYLLRNFVRVGIPCLGIEPTDSTAEVAEAQGVPTLRQFFSAEAGEQLGSQGQAADLIIGNNVYAHVPDINDFTAGLAAALKPEGVVTLEFPHLMRLVEFSQFDTVYHEHFSYLSLAIVARIFAASGLRVFDVEELSTHGGSLRVFGCLTDASHLEQPGVADVLDEEARRGMNNHIFYDGFQRQADKIKDELLRFLLQVKAEGKTIAAYGAAAKGNTLLNYAGVRPDLLPFVCDAAEAKIGKFMPGSQIPIRSPDVLRSVQPDYLLILPWNIVDEVCDQNAALAEKGVRFVTVVPELRIR